MPATTDLKDKQKRRKVRRCADPVRRCQDGMLFSPVDYLGLEAAHPLVAEFVFGDVQRRCNRAVVSTEHTTAINSIKQKAVSCQHRTYDSDAIKQKAVAGTSTEHTTAINSIKQKAVSCQHRTYDSDAIKQKAVAGTSTEHTTAINLIKQNAVASTEHNGRGRLRPRPVGEYFGVDKDIQAGGRTEVRIHSLSITVKTPR